MKKVLFTLCLIISTSALTVAQSKLSYSLLVNNSASTDDTYSVCIFQIDGGVCLDMETAWKVNFTAAVNYEVNERLRLQSGLGYNVLSMDELNEEFRTDQFKIKYLSIPIRAHYFLNKGKTRVYTGLGLRTDIRTNGTIPQTESSVLNDNGRGIAVSMEALIGIEVPILRAFSLSLEPTYAQAITPYATNLHPNGSANALSLLPEGIVDEYPSRLGFSVGLTYKF